MCLCALQSRQKRPEVRDSLFALELLPQPPFYAREGACSQELREPGSFCGLYADCLQTGCKRCGGGPRIFGAHLQPRGANTRKTPLITSATWPRGTRPTAHECQSAPGIGSQMQPRALSAGSRFPVLVVLDPQHRPAQRRATDCASVQFSQAKSGRKCVVFFIP